MKSFIIALFVACFTAVIIADASLVEDAAPFLEEIEILPVRWQQSRSAVPLSSALGLPPGTPGIKQLETLIVGELGQQIRGELEGVLEKLEDLTGEGNKKFHALLESIVNLPKEGKPTKENAEIFIAQISQQDRQRGFIGVALDESFEQKALSITTWNAIEARGIKDWWNKVVNWFKGLGSKISDKFKQFKEWAKDVFEKVINGIKPLAEQILKLAIEFLKQNWDKIATEVVKQALGFFNEYAGILGEEIMKQLIELARQHHLIPWEKAALLYLH